MSDKNNYPGENNTGHFWDDEGDIRELKNRPPRWYMWALYIGIVSVFIYAYYFPSVPWFGTHYKGVSEWTQIQEFDEGVKVLQEFRKTEFSELEDKISKLPLSDILKDDQLKMYSIKSSKTAFGDNCAGCHGANGQGNKDFPVLADDDWLYGGSVQQINTSITKGRKGNMPAQMMGITEDEAHNLSSYLLSLNDDTIKANPSSKGLYASKGCVGCHAPTMKGNKFMGSADLSDSIYRFKDTDQLASYKKTIMYGVNQKDVSGTRNAVMPAFNDSPVLTSNQIKKLTIFVHSLGGGK